jgi:hypothetical protein
MIMDEHTFLTQEESYVNPGSLGQPKTGRPLACYAIWEDGKVSLKEYDYPLQKTIRHMRRMPLSKQDIEELAAVLETGELSIPGDPPSQFAHSCG